MRFESEVDAVQRELLEDSKDSIILSGEVSQLSQSDGSATFNHGDEASAMAAVYGPGDVRPKRELIDRAFIDVNFQCKSGQSGCVERFTQHIIAQTCETAIKSALHPRSAIAIIIQVLHGTDSSALLACCINAAFLALLDAGISLDFLVGAVSCQINSDGKISLDCCGKEHDEDNAPVADVTLAFENQQNHVVSCVANGKYTSEQLKECANICQTACVDVFSFYRSSLVRKLSKTT